MGTYHPAWTPHDLRALGLRLLEARAAVGLSREKFSQDLRARYGYEVSPRALSYYETGEREPPVSLLYVLCAKLGHSPEWLLMGWGDGGDAVIPEVQQLARLADEVAELRRAREGKPAPQGGEDG